MKNAKTTVTLTDGILSISRKKHANTSYLSLGAEVKWIKQAKVPPVDSCQSHIRIPASLRNEIPSKYCTLVNLSNGLFTDVIIEDSVSTENGEIAMTRFTSELLGADETSDLVICRQNYLHFDSVKIQTLENIKDDVVVVPEGEHIEELKKDFRLFEIINPLTNDSIFVRPGHIICDPALKSNEIRINKKQRNMLSDNIPARLTADQWESLLSCEEADSKIREALLQSYLPDGEGYIISQSIDELGYGIRQFLQKFIKKSFGEELIMRPVIETFHYEKKKSLLRKLGDFFVGNSTLSLNCRRPHECDENSSIVRMSENNMQFLGIEPMDKVIIRYKENEVSCNVLPFKDDKFGKTNIPSIIELSVGIPAHIRKALKIDDIQSSVKIDRDTGFIFKKSFNEQLVPIILAILSLKFFEDLPWWGSLLIISALIPVVMYITLSSKRNMRGK